MAKKPKTQVKGVSVKGKTVKVRPTVSSDSVNVSYPQETIAEITQPNASQSLHYNEEKASYTLPSLEPLDTSIFERLSLDPNRFRARKKSFGWFGGCNWKVWGIAFSVDLEGWETSIDFQLGPLYASVYYG